MSVADLTLAAYALLTIVSLFGAGRLWGPGTRPGGWRRGLGTIFAAAETLLLTYYLVWTDDRFHRAAYMVMDAAVVLVVLSAAALVLFSLRRGRRGSLMTAAAAGAIGILAAAFTILSRDSFWQPFAVFALALFAGPAAALVPRWRIVGYRPLRDPEFFPWLTLAVLGFWAVGETVSMVGLVPGTAWFGRPSLLHFFLAGTVAVTWLAPSQTPQSPPSTPEGRIPWHLFNPPLSPREADLLEGLRRRLTNKELAAETGVTESTVKKHLVSVFRKAGVASRQELFERLDAVP